MRHRSVLAVVLLVVLAGCGGAPGGETVTTDSTTAVTTTAEMPAGESASETGPSSGEPERPPGLGANGVTDAEALAVAHADALANRSYTYVREATVVAANGSELGRWSQRVQVGSDRLEFAFTQTGAGVTVGGAPVDEFRKYTDGSTTYSNASALPGGYARSDGRGFAESRFDGELLLAEALNGSDTGVTTVERDGETRYLVRVESERGRPLSGLSEQGVAVEVRVDATNLTATALVAPSGFVENVTYEYDFERGNVTGHRTETVRYAAVGETTVERPAWYDDAREATNATDE